MKYTNDVSIGLGACDSMEAALQALKDVSTGDLLSLADLPGSAVVVDGEAISYDQISKASADGLYGAGVLQIGGQFIPIINAGDLNFTTTIDDDEEVREALQSIADTDEAEQPEAIATMIGFLSDGGKDALKAIAEDENEELQATAKLVMDTIEPPDEAETEPAE